MDSLTSHPLKQGQGQQKNNQQPSNYLLENPTNQGLYHLEDLTQPDNYSLSSTKKPSQNFNTNKPLVYENQNNFALMYIANSDKLQQQEYSLTNNNEEISSENQIESEFVNNPLSNFQQYSNKFIMNQKQFQPVTTEKQTVKSSFNQLNNSQSNNNLELYSKYQNNNTINQQENHQLTSNPLQRLQSSNKINTLEYENGNSPYNYPYKDTISSQKQILPAPLMQKVEENIELRFSEVKPMKEHLTTKSVKNEVENQIEQKLFEFDDSAKNKLDTKALNFYQEYALVQQQPVVHNKDLIEKKKTITKKSITSLQEQVKKQNFSNKQNDYQDLALLSLYTFYQEQGFNNIFIDNTKNVVNEPSTVEKFQQQIVSTGQISNLKYLEVKFEDTQDFTYEKITADSKLRNDTIKKFKEAIADQLKISVDRVVILNILKGSVKIEFMVKDFEELEKISNKTFRKLGLPDPTIQIKTLLDYFTLNYQLFDPRYNMYWDVNDNQNLTRGKLFIKSQNKYIPQPYHLPKGYNGYGINVQKWLQIDKTWLGTDENAWIVLYHGTTFVSGIMKEKIKPGPTNGYGGAVCRITGENIKQGPNVNTYLADNVGPNGSDPYAKPITIGGKQYKIIFQCRVNPLAVRSPTSYQTYYTVEDSKYDVKENIRPYRLLIKEV